MRRPNYETDGDSFPSGAYRFEQYAGVSFYVQGWETEPDEDTEWTGYETRTGRIVATMIGDDRRFTFDPEEAIPLDRSEYCGECGQIGCTHDGFAQEGE